jgi:hypothetical protein
MANTLIIGDVHGCSQELDCLLAEAGHRAGDPVVFVGDVVARGPDSRGVLECIRRLGAKSVLGNHEARLLEVRRARAQGEPGPRLGPAHEELLAELSGQDWRDLAGFPLWLDLPEHDVRVVHAGLVPGVAMSEQDPWALTHMRSLGSDGTASDKRSGTLWGARYRGTPHVVFGHNAIDGIQLHPDATGLDSGCVYGGALTALLLPAGAKVPPPAERQLVSVKARRAYVTAG